MNAAAVIPDRKFVFACVDCGQEILGAGGSYAEITQISYGQICEVHGEGRPDMAATHAVVRPDGWTRTMRAPVLPIAYPPQPAGTLTRITSELVIAWSKDEKHADAIMVDAAAHVARLILAATQGE